LISNPYILNPAIFCKLLSDVTAYKDHKSKADPYVTKTDNYNKCEPKNFIMKSAQTVSGTHSASNPIGTRDRGAMALS
jgi:hypothetical protein